MRTNVERFVEEWIQAWNSNDLDGLLRHYREDAVFRSPRAELLVGTAVVSGKLALRTYWGTAIHRAASRRFVLDTYVWDGEQSVLVISYSNQVDGVATRACEIFWFDADGLVSNAEALYGASDKNKDT